MKFLIAFLLLLAPVVLAAPYGNSSYGNGSYVGVSDSTPPVTTLTINPSHMPLVSTSSISCLSDDSSGVISVIIHVDNIIRCNTTNYDGQASMQCAFSFTPSQHSDVTKNFTISCRTEDLHGLTTNKTGSLYAVRDDGASSGGSGGGGGGGSAPAPDKIVNIIDVVAPLAPASVAINKADVDVNEIQIEVNAHATSVKITLSRLETPPASVPAASGKTFQLLDISKENIADSNIKSAKIKFTVSKAWLVSNEFSRDDVVLKRFNATWQNLPTTFLRDMGHEIEYEAVTPGFSLFAITAETKTPTPISEPVEKPTLPQINITYTEPANAYDLRDYVQGAADFIGSLLPSDDPKERSIYLLGVFVILQLAIYFIINKLLNEKKKKIAHDPIKIRHNEKLHRAIIWIMVLGILAVAIFIMRI